MLRYDDLTQEQINRAIKGFEKENLDLIVRNIIRFNDEANLDDVQSRIDAIRDRMDELQTPWFLAEALMEDEKVRDLVESMAVSDAQEAFYPEGGDFVAAGVWDDLRSGAVSTSPYLDENVVFETSDDGK